MTPAGDRVGSSWKAAARVPNPGSPRPARTELLNVAAVTLMLFVFSVSSVAGDAGRLAGGPRATRSTAPASPAPRQEAVSDPRDDALLAQQLAAARQVASRYPTLADALADGFTQAAPYAPGIGSHYMRYDRIYLPFDVTAPSMVLFDGDLPSSKIVGLAYYVYSSAGPPAGFAGPFDHWHQHQWTCVDKAGAHFGGDDDSAGCRGRGRNAWMLHLWVVGNRQSLQTVFSDECNILT